MLRVSWVGCLVFYLFVLGTDWLVDALDPSIPRILMAPTLFIPRRPMLPPFLTTCDDEFFSPRLPLHHLQLTPASKRSNPRRTNGLLAQAAQHHVHAVPARRPGERPGELGT